MVEYIESLAMEESLDVQERHSLLVEYLTSLELSPTIDIAGIVREYLDTVANNNSSEIPGAAPGKADAVAICLEVIRAPVVSTETKTIGESDDFKKTILRIYDVEDGCDPEGDDEIMGLGRNENKLRVIKDREEARVRAKKEQEELAAQKVAQKLKSQGETIKSRTVARKK